VVHCVHLLLIAILRRKVGNAVYLEEYYPFRVKGKVKTEFVRYLGREGTCKALPVKREIDTVQNSGSSGCGDVSLLWALSVDLGIPDILDRCCSSNSSKDGPTSGKLLTVLAINRMLHPESTSMLPSWIEGTNLPRISGIESSIFTKDAFLNSLDTVGGEDDHGRIVDRTELLDRELFNRFREKYPLNGEGKTLACSMTTVLFFGVTCPLTELGYSSDGLNMMQVNAWLRKLVAEQAFVIDRIRELNEAVTRGKTHHGGVQDNDLRWRHHINLRCRHAVHIQVYIPVCEERLIWEAQT